MRYFILAICFLIAFGFNKAFAYTIMTDENAFFSLYENPSQEITFDNLIDGTSYPPDLSNPLVLHSHSGGEYSVREYSFSNDYLFRGKTGGSSFWLAVNWDSDQGERYIIPDFNGTLGRINNFSIYTLHDVSPIAIYTEPNHSGFLGIIPDGSDDRHYVIYSNQASRIFEMQSAFTVVPEPISSFLFITGGAILATRKYFTCKSP